ncbi:MAG: NAD(P)H-hydrate dehydratase [Candidatus Hydrothermarchaeales archaeon]
MDYLGSREAKILDINSSYFGVPQEKLMEAAGKGVFEVLKENFNLKGKKVAVFCGPGNNGGDGFVCARYLDGEGAEVEIFADKKVQTDEAAKNFERIKGRVPIMSLRKPSYDADIVVDALLGTGVKGELRAPIKSVVKGINRSKAFKVSIDLPSGISDEGKGYCVKADLVVTLHRLKRGLEGYKTVVKDIGIPEEAETHVGPGDIIVNLARKLDSHKGENGRVLVIGGSDFYYGAPILGALGALNSGADLVYLAVPECNYEVTRCHSPDFIVSKFPGHFLNPTAIEEIQVEKRGIDSVLIGPGLGTRDETKEAVLKLLEKIEVPVVLDADAIKAVAGKTLKGLKVVTPHAGEFEILTCEKLPKDNEKRREVVVRYAKRLGAVILLKAPLDIVASPQGKAKFNATGNAGMTVGGTGDVLAGVIAGFLAQGLSAFDATCCAAFVNGVAGDELATWKGNCFTASDLAEELPYTIKRILDFE